MALIFIFLFSLKELNAQSEIKAKIIGHVSDTSTSLPISDVNVFLSTTTIGSATDRNGKYEIDNIPEGSYTLVVSHIGYQWQSTPIKILKSETIELDFNLTPQVIYSSEVVVTADKPAKWKEELKTFTEEFLGTDEFSDYCTIINPEVLNFKEDESKNTLTASTDSTIVVDNYALGYRIELILAKFEYKPNEKIQYFVLPKFQLLKPKDANEEQNWKINRLYCYKGSLRHFLSAVARNKIEKEGFKLLKGDLEKLITGSGDYLDPDKLMIVPDNFSSHVRFIYQGYLEVEYLNSINNPPSILKFNSGYALIDTLGNIYNQFPFDEYGYWTQDRLSHLLPLDFIPPHE
ncbi:MAG: carboxypeptidase-like regulatory domain-containing protein [Bacteroidetes bacterium]|nr:carboxypeptidase-like regulatory domain-containing protein [Bacteroidota bacterium]